MSCCKKTNDVELNSIMEVSDKKSIFTIVKKSLLFLILAIVITPFIIPIFLVVLFRLVVLSKKMNLLPIALIIGKKIFKDDDDDEDDELDDVDDDDLDENEYELINKEELVVLK